MALSAAPILLYDDDDQGQRRFDLSKSLGYWIVLCTVGDVYHHRPNVQLGAAWNWQLASTRDRQHVGKTRADCPRQYACRL